MKKLFKLIAASTLAFAMLVGLPTTAMASEPVNTVDIETVDSTDVARASTLIKSYTCNKIITKGATLDSVTLNSRAKTIEFCVNGTGGNVIIRLTNPSTGDSRSFTAIGDGRWSSITYTSYMTTGTYNVTVEYVSGIAHNQLKMNFYN